MSDATHDRNGRTPEDAVVAYLALRREWDLSTYERVTGLGRTDAFDPDRPPPFDNDALATALPDLERLRRDWCTPAALARIDRRASFGNSSPFNPDGSEVLSSRQLADDEVVLRTREFPFDAGLATDCEYVVRRVNDEWRIDSRIADGIHDLL